MLTTVVGTAALIPATLAYLTRRHVPLPVTLVLAHFAAAGFAVALAATDRFAASSTSILGKQPSGAVAWWGWGLFWPYYLSLQMKLWMQRQYSVEPVWNYIVDGWYLGGWPASLAMTPKGDPAILDCTCELPRMQRHLPYLNLPVWDTHGWLGARSAPSKARSGCICRATQQAPPALLHISETRMASRSRGRTIPEVSGPAVRQIDRGVKWALEQRSAGRPVLLHCAHRHGLLTQGCKAPMPRDSGHAGPAVRQIDRGVKWALEQRSAERPVLVHCAHGHGRSLVLMCAILVVSGQAGGFLEAYKMVKAARPKVRLNGRQHTALVQWQEQWNLRRKVA